MATAHINGIAIRYEDSGSSGPTVLFSHGFMMDHTMFNRQVEALSAEYRCISWDARGFGDTAAPEVFSYWDSANDAVALLDHLGIDKAVFVGMSQGGFLSLRAALAHPSRVRGIALIDSAASVDAPEVIAGYEGMLEALCGDDEATYDAVASGVGQIILGDAALAASWLPIWKARRAADRDGVRIPGGALISRDDISDRMSEISCPVLVIHGTADAAFPLEVGRAIAESVKDSRGMVVIEGGSHSSNLTHPAEVNTALMEFLGSL
jgi:3-oxoadipate enol-lactonase